MKFTKFEACFYKGVNEASFAFFVTATKFSPCLWVSAESASRCDSLISEQAFYPFSKSDSHMTVYDFHQCLILFVSGRCFFFSFIGRVFSIKSLSFSCNISRYHLYKIFLCIPIYGYISDSAWHVSSFTKLLRTIISACYCIYFYI